MLCYHGPFKKGIKMEKILFYKPKNANGYLSNFYKSKIYYRGKWWRTSEHLYQALKSIDVKEQEYVRHAETAWESKKRGGEITLREDWEKIKYDIMKIVLIQKFTQNPKLMRMLLATSDAELIENSPIDYVWGCGKDFSGQNLLGKALMEVRDHFNEN